jgi:(+)-trans-carveol dehydrogenase
VSAKHGLVGLMRTLALDLIRVNSVHPTTVNTDMIQNAAAYELFAPDLPEDERTPEVIRERLLTINTLPVPWIEPVDVSNAVLWLASDEARYVTGVPLPVDAGELLK